ncbi:hypothetical protein [Streptosporangium sp. NPDC006007]
MLPAELPLVVVLASGVALPGSVVAVAETAVVLVLILEAVTAYRR